MSTKHVRTAADLVRFGCSLRVECSACAAANTLSGVEVVQRCGPGALERIGPMPRFWLSYSAPLVPYRCA